MRTSPLPRMSRRGRVTIGVLIGVFLLFTLLGWVVDAWTDWLWFREVSFTEVFSHVLRTRLLLFGIVGVAMALIVAGNLYLAYRVRPMLRPHSSEQATLERYRMALSPRIGTWIGLLAAVIGFFAGLSAQTRWGEWMLFRNSQPFGQRDPQFNVDISFYVFEYPFWRYVIGVGFTVVVLSVIGSLAMHYIYGGVRLQGVGDRMSTAARAHLTTLVAIFVLLKAVAYFLDRRALLLGYNEGARMYGAGYTDINALLPAKEILAYISIVVAVAIIVFSNAMMRNLVWPGVSLALLGIAAVAIGGIYPWAVQTFTVKPSLLNKEASYMQRSIDATREAFGLSAVTSTEYPAANLIPQDNLLTETSVVPYIRLLDPELVSETFTTLQQVRGFYDFGNKLDIDRYTTKEEGKEEETHDYVVGVREINYDKLTDQQSNWLNRHTVYTHGFGLVTAPANEVRCGGQPYFVSGFLDDETNRKSCSSQAELLPVDEPRIYYGELMTDADYAVVGSSGQSRVVEFDRPVSGDGGDQQAGGPGQYYTYAGTGGVALNSFARKLLYAVKERESNFLLSDAINKNSKLLYVRNPRERVQKVAPFLTIDGDPYPAEVDGKIVWILDGYTTSATYPYSQRINLQAETTDETTGVGTFRLQRENVNYMRNSVKATVDAYNGTVTLYGFDETDPVLKAWNKAFGGKLITPKSQIPEDLAAHLRYPADQFKVQRNLLARFHVTKPEDFFSGQNFWDVPNTPDRPDSGVKQPPYYLYTKLPEQDGPRFQLTSALTPRNRQNLAALISGSYVDGKPKLEVLKLPDNTAIQGPVQVHQRMTNIGSVRTALSQLNADGQADVLYGNLLSLPVSNGMLYVEPVYVRSKQADAYPTLQKVLLSYGDGGQYVVLADDIDSGIKQLIAAGKSGAAPPAGGTTTTPPSAGGNPGTVTAQLATAATKLRSAIAEVKAAQVSGDFARYGRALTALDVAMSEFDRASRAANGTSGGGTTPPSPPPSSPPGSPTPTTGGSPGPPG